MGSMKNAIDKNHGLTHRVSEGAEPRVRHVS